MVRKMKCMEWKKKRRGAKAQSLNGIYTMKNESLNTKSYLPVHILKLRLCAFAFLFLHN
jgi:hypothetical protein